MQTDTRFKKKKKCDIPPGQQMTEISGKSSPEQLRKPHLQVSKPHIQTKLKDYAQK